MSKVSLESLLSNYKGFHPVVLFNPLDDKLTKLDFTETNKDLTDEIINNTDLFSGYVNGLLVKNLSKYGIGGYNEHRVIYRRSTVFDEKDAEPRRLHLGIDIWGPAEVPIYAPLEGNVHSFAFNDAFGDYGATLILQHELDACIFHTLYGHLSLASINTKREGQTVEKGEWIAAFGVPSENGNWPPHLHFQIISNMESKKGDYPGVCKYSEKETYLANCPNPDFILDLIQFAPAIQPTI